MYHDYCYQDIEKNKCMNDNEKNKNRNSCNSELMSCMNHLSRNLQEDFLEPSSSIYGDIFRNAAAFIFK